MAKINTHGLKMHGLKKASGETQNYGYYSGSYVQINYDVSTGDVWTDYHYSLGQNSWTEYRDSDVITVCRTSCHMTMQEIADAISDAISDADEVAAANEAARMWARG
jgi:hypothetical protein